MPFKSTKKTKLPPTTQRKIDGVNEPDENDKILNLLNPDAKKNKPLDESRKVNKPQGQKCHFTLNKMLNWKY
ncbi:hypothetical protein Hanom_Chr12g01140681 [Helianthus anomalus]